MSLVRLIENVFTDEEEAALLAIIEGLPFHRIEMGANVEASDERVVCFGWEYLYRPRKVRPGDPMPSWIIETRQRCAERSGFEAETFDQAIVRRYRAGDDITPHTDAPVFGPDILGLSLGSTARLDFQRTDDKSQRFSITLPPRSLYVLEGEIRSEWKHRVPPVRELRYSITFRSVLESAKKNRASER